MGKEFDVKKCPCVYCRAASGSEQAAQELERKRDNINRCMCYGCTGEMEE